ncbi:ornithine carbamoyltransferase [Entomobacter blattae]|uniref:Ornithine carbamoyltransferase n=1 Tax=Entomobacter blattae TaxID=2762277 RepID=A0A7H1NUR3_9PROT|nr:ornithine carbamoyltransferase [Entomobacter blattae]QNT79523.1 Ornithine carbamoyltransferase, anabolic [Entomobacter blattae]
MSDTSPLSPSTNPELGVRHFLNLSDFPPQTLREILDTAASIKRMQQNRRYPLHPKLPLLGRTLGLMLTKPSTRTRVSFEVGMRQLGGQTVVLSPKEMQLGRGETMADTARVLSRFVDVIVLRTGDTQQLTQLAQWSTVPVINGLTPDSHPAQVMADIMTFEEHKGPIKGRHFAWVGDGNNVASSFMEAAAQFGFSLSLATPKELAPSEKVLSWARAQGAKIHVTTNPAEAVKGADCVVTDTWVSMSDTNPEERIRRLVPYRVDAALMNAAAPDAVFMHCLPAHVGEEVTADVFEGPASIVFDEAENRLHAQKGILIWAMGGKDWRNFGVET